MNARYTIAALCIGLGMATVAGNVKAQSEGKGSEFFFSFAGGANAPLQTVGSALTSSTTFGGGAGIGFSYFFGKHVAFNTGLEYNLFTGKLHSAQFSDSYKMTDEDVPPQDFQFKYNMHEFSEQQRLAFLTIPLTISGHFGENIPVYAAVGAGIGFPMRSSYSSSAKLLEARGLYSGGIGEIDRPLSRGFGDFTPSGSGELKLNKSYMFIGELGLRWTLGNKACLYTGLYLNYGLNDVVVQPEAAHSPLAGKPGAENNDPNPARKFYSLQSMTTASDGRNQRFVEKVTPVTFGVKIRIALRPSGNTTKNHSEWRHGNIYAQTTDTVYIHDSIYIQTPSASKYRTVAENEAENKLNRIRNSTASNNNSGPLPDAGKLARFEKDISGFPTASSRLSTNIINALDEKVYFLKKYNTLIIIIEGHCDNTGSRATNEELGMERAVTVRQYLIRNGIAPYRIHITSKGAAEPLVPNNSEANRSINRRVKMVVMEDLNQLQ